MKIYKAHIPVLRILLPFITGVALGCVSVLISQVFQIFLLLGSFLILFFTRKLCLFDYIWGICFMILGFSIAQFYREMNSVNAGSEGKYEFIGTIFQTKPSKKGVQLYVDVALRKSSESWEETSYRQYVFLQTDCDEQFQVNDTLQYLAYQHDVTNTVELPWEFNFSRYLLRQDVIRKAFLEEKNILSHRRCREISFLPTIQAYSEKIKSAVRTALPSESSAIVLSVLLGDKTDLTEVQEKQFRNAGLMHVLAVSGLHVGVVFGCIVWLLHRFSRRLTWKNKMSFIGLLVTWFFIGLCGFPSSACRAGLMLTFYVVGKYIHPRLHTLNLLSASALILVVWNPFVIFNIGFQFSYTAVLGIFFLFQPILKYISKVPLPQYILKGISISMAAQLALTPLSMYYFGYLPLWFWLTSMPGIFIATLILWVGIMYILTLLIYAPLSVFVGKLLSFLAQGLELVSQSTSYLYLQGIVFYPNFWMMVAAVTAIVVFIYGRIYTFAELRKWAVGVIFLPFILCSFSFLEYVERQYAYIFSADGSVAIVYVKGGDAYVVGDEVPVSLVENIATKLNVDVSSVALSDKHEIIIDSISFTKLSTSDFSEDFVVVDIPYHNLPKSILQKLKRKYLMSSDNSYPQFVLSEKLGRSNIYRWKRVLEEFNATVRDVRFQHYKIK